MIKLLLTYILRCFFGTPEPHAFTEEIQDKEQPNVLFICVDDLKPQIDLDIKNARKYLNQVFN